MELPLLSTVLTLAVPVVLLCGVLSLLFLRAAASSTVLRVTLWTAAVVAVVALGLCGMRLLSEGRFAPDLSKAGPVTLLEWLPQSAGSWSAGVALRLQLSLSAVLCVAVLLICAASLAGRSGPLAGHPRQVLLLCLCGVLSLLSVDPLTACLFWLLAVNLSAAPAAPPSDPSAGRNASSPAAAGQGAAYRTVMLAADLLLLLGVLSLEGLRTGAVLESWPLVDSVQLERAAGAQSESVLFWMCLAICGGVGLRVGLLPFCGLIRGRSRSLSPRMLAGTAIVLLPVALILLLRMFPILRFATGARLDVVLWALLSAVAVAALATRAGSLPVLAGCTAAAVFCLSLAGYAVGTSHTLQASLLLVLGGAPVLAAGFLSGEVRLSSDERGRSVWSWLALCCGVLFFSGVCGWNALTSSLSEVPQPEEPSLLWEVHVPPAAAVFPLLAQFLLTYSWIRWWFSIPGTTAGQAGNRLEESDLRSGRPVERPPLTAAVVLLIPAGLVAGSLTARLPVARSLAETVGASPASLFALATSGLDFGLLAALAGGAGGWFAAVRNSRRRRAGGTRGIRQQDRLWRLTEWPAEALFRGVRGLAVLVAWLDRSGPKLAVRQLGRRCAAAAGWIEDSLASTSPFLALAMLLATAILLWGAVLSGR